MNIFESKVYRILAPVYDNEKENWRTLNNKEIYANVKKLTIIKTVRLNRLRLFGHVQRMEENRIPKRVLHRVIRNDCWGFNNCHLVLQMQPHVIFFYGVMSRIKFMFLLFPQVSWN